MGELVSELDSTKWSTDAWAGGAGGGEPPAPPSQEPDQDRAVTPDDPRWRPGQVPWGWRRTVLGAFVAAAPVVALNVVAILSPTTSTSTKPTTAIALSTLVITLLIDSWFVFAVWLFSLRRSGLGWRGWGFRRLRPAMAWAVPVSLFGLYVVESLWAWLINPKEQTVVEQFPRSTAGLVLLALTACVVAPVYEEIVFRGFLFQGLASSWGGVWGGVASATLFGLSHLQLDIFVPLFALGAALVWIFSYTRTLWACIALHALFNGVAVLSWAFV